MRDRINGLGFARAEALYAGSPGAPKLSHSQRSRILADFHDGQVGILCAVDLLNEGIDLPDVNIVVFQRVTHSRRIFIQQLGRGLRLASGKEKVIVLDFVSDIRRFAAGLDLQNRLQDGPQYVTIGSAVRFMNVNGEDKRAESFLREWLEDVAAVEMAGEDEHILKFPPSLSGRV
jgi:ERCC4-related helicase